MKKNKSEAKDARPAHKRGKLFVDAKVQGALMRQVMLHWCVTNLLLFVYLFATEVLLSGFEGGVMENLQSLGRQYGLLLIVLATLSPVFIYDTIKLSHRVVGPMVSFRAGLKKLVQGEDYTPVTFRDGDHWAQLAVDLNSLAEELQELREKDRAREEQAELV